MRQRFDGDLFLRESTTDGPVRGTLLYIHGLGESGLGLEPLLTSTALSEWHQLVPDLPGYGKSPWPEEDPATAATDSLEQHAETLIAWLERRREQPVVLVGHSMGGAIGTLVAEQAPEKVRAFFDIEGNVTLDDCTYSLPIAETSREDFLTSELDAMREKVYQRGTLDPAEGAASFRSYFASLCLCDPRTLHANALDLVRVSRSESLATRLGALDRPTCYVLGSPRGTGARSRAQVEAAGVEVAVVDQAGHWPWLDGPDRFTDLLIGFLARLEDGDDV